MDDAVRNALARWPDVPAAYGWLSLSARGEWRFHPGGMAGSGGTGESITNQQILAFIGRNYQCDEAGQWFFQNGPQRAYVRIDAAPLILRYTDNNDGWMDHAGRHVTAPTAWWLDDQGRLFAQTERGPGMVDDRELMAVLADMSIADSDSKAQENTRAANELPGDRTLDRLAGLAPGNSLSVRHRLCVDNVRLTGIHAGDVPTVLGFVSHPQSAGL